MVFVQLGLQEAEVSELFHKDVILLLQIFLNLLILIHESGPEWLEWDNIFTQATVRTDIQFGVGSASFLLACELTSHSAVFEASSYISPALVSFSLFCCQDWFHQTQRCPACLWSSPHFPDDKHKCTVTSLVQVLH